MRDLSGKRVLLTGATGGLGRALARAFGAEGARLALLDRDREALSALAEELDAPCTQTYDATDSEGCRAAITAAVGELGGADILVNNAGLTQRSAFVETRLEVYRRVMEVNFFGSLACTQAAIEPLIASRGQIVVISSVAGFAPVLGRSGYCASKHALVGLFTTLRTELAARGVRVLIVAPAFVRTPIDVNALGGDGGRARRPQSRVGGLVEAGEAARAIVRAVRRDRRLLLIGRAARLAHLIASFWPSLYEKLMARSLSSELET